MLEIDDDDILEQQHEEREAANTHVDTSELPSASAVEEASAAAEDDREISAGSVTAADFELLPFCAELLRAHQQGGDAQVLEGKMRALRRAVRRAENRFAVLSAAVGEGDADPDAAQTLLEARTKLLRKSTRKRERE